MAFVQARRRGSACVLTVVGLLSLGQARSLDLPLPAVRGEPPTPERVELGRRLFFDPILSRDGDMSCATCHQPDKAFTDGLPKAIGRGGIELAQNTPTILNAALRPRLFWDGRAPDLESQAREVLLSPQEMAADPEQLVARLRQHPDYGTRFTLAFPEAPADAAVTFENVTRALAAFERSLVSAESRYDRFVRGDRNALTDSERSGLKLFRSPKTRCFECHPPPTFSSPVPTSIGLPVGGEGAASRLRVVEVPSLRNVARTPPYMHDGSLGSLEAVIEFYEGQGPAHRARSTQADPRIRSFALSEQEKADLIAFLRSLTQETTIDLVVPVTSGTRGPALLSASPMARRTHLRRGILKTRVRAAYALKPPRFERAAIL